MLLKKGVKTGSFHLILGVDKDCQKFLRDLSSRFNGIYRSNFMVDDRAYKPHITLYLFSAPLKNIQAIVRQVDKISIRLKRTSIDIDEMILSDSGWIMIDVDMKSKQILKWHKIFVSSINKLREGMLRKKYRNKNYFDRQKPKEKLSLLKYGDKHAFGLYHSHLSVAQYDDQLAASRAFNKLKDISLPSNLSITSIELVRSIGDETGGVGKVLYFRELK